MQITKLFQEVQSCGPSTAFRSQLHYISWAVNLLLWTIFPPSHSPFVIMNPARLRTLDRSGSFNACRTSSAHVLEYLRYVIPAARQYCTIAEVEFDASLSLSLTSTFGMDRTMPYSRDISSACEDENAELICRSYRSIETYGRCWRKK